VSSDYRILCLTHDPALRLGEEDRWLRPEPAFAAVADPGSCDLTAAHTGCDLLVERHSGSLIEMACPPSKTPDARTGPSHTGWHRDPKWIGVEWLRLLWHASQLSGASEGLVAARSDAARSGCWPISRVDRLRYEIGAVAVGEPPTSCCPACDQAAAEALRREEPQ
jgi:hypothetical protein